jgi:hypothetical protein
VREEEEETCKKGNKTLGGQHLMKEERIEGWNTGI